MDLLEALDTFGIPYKPHGSAPNEIWLCCPFCQETRFRLGVNVVTGKMHCFNDNCDTASSNPDYTFRVLGEQLELGTLEAAAKGAKKKSSATNAIVRLPDDFTVLRKNDDEYWGRLAYKYAKRRGITYSQIKEKRIGYTLTGDYAYRIIFPVYYRGKLKGIVSRDFTGKSELKYKNSAGDKHLYNYPTEVIHDRAILVEGVFDALAVERGVGSTHDALAVLGHSLTERQLKQLKPYNKIWIWTDPDKAGIAGIQSMATVLRPLNKKVYVVLPKLDGEDYDPSDMFPKEVRRRISNAVLYTDHVIDRLKTDVVFQE